MKKRIEKVYILLLVIVIVLAACQPTQKENAVIQKDNFENQINNTSVPSTD